MSGCDTDLIGFVRMGCPRCTYEILYREDSSFRPLCQRCGRKMKPMRELKGCDEDER